MKKNSPKVSCEREVSDLHIQRGQTLIVWMQIAENKRIQVELRVDYDDKAQIFVDNDVPVEVKPYKDWKSIYDDY